jgi:hypothetical protein
MSKVKRIVALNSVTLESTDATTQAAAARTLIDTYESSKLNLVVKYTTGAAETNNTCAVKVWGYIGIPVDTNELPNSATPNTTTLSDSANWIQLGTSTNSSGTVTFTPAHYDVVGASAATGYVGQFLIDICVSKIVITASESGVAANKGTVSATCFIQ